MSNITYMSNGVTTYYSIQYKSFFQKKIYEICEKIDFDDSDVKWIIYNAERKSKSIKDVLIGRNGKCYGYCCPSKNEIWISTLSLDAGIRFAEDNRTEKSFNLEIYERDLLTDVMIDEITHIQTGCDHNNERYEAQLRMNYRKLKGK